MHKIEDLISNFGDQLVSDIKWITMKEKIDQIAGCLA